MKGNELPGIGGLFHRATFFLLIGLGASQSAAQDEWLPPDLQLPAMRAGNIYAEGTGVQEIKVFYPGHVDEGFLGDGDLWVVSQNGYNQLAGLQNVERIPYLPLPVEPQDPSIEPFPGEILVATYTVFPPTDAGWNQENNGRYAVLLEPRQVAFENGGFLKERLLGSFHVRIGGSPGLPLETSIEIVRENGNLSAVVKLTFPHPGYEVVNWGEVRRDGTHLSVNIEILKPDENLAYPDVIDERVHRYPLPALEAGAYQFTVFSGDHQLASTEFEIDSNSPPVPAEVQMDIRTSADGQLSAHVVIHFLDPYFVLLDQGHPVLEGHRFTIEAEAGKVVFIRAPDEPAITEVDYPLDVPDPGEYEAVFKMNGFVYAKREFVYPPYENHRPVIHFFDAEPKVVEPGDEVTLFWEVTGADHLRIEPGVGEVQGNSITVPAEILWPVPLDAAGDPTTAELPPEFTNGATVILIAANEFGETRAETTVFMRRNQDYPIPEGAEITVEQGDVSWFAQVEVGLPPNAFVTFWSDFERHENTFTADVLLEWYPDEPVVDPASPDGSDGNINGIAPPAPEPPINTYNLGILEPGSYVFQLTSRGHVVSRKEFIVGPNGGNGGVFAVLKAEPVTEAGLEAQRFTVVYESQHGIDPNSLGDDDILVKSFARFIDVFPLPVWETRPAELVNFEISDDARRVEAVYQVAAPDGGWQAKHNGAYDVFLQPESVKTLEGHFATGRQLGSFEVRIDPEQPGIAAVLRAEPITQPGNDPHRFRVVFESSSPLGLDSFDDEDIRVVSWVVLADFIGEPPIWAFQNARFVDLEANSDHTRVVAVYEISPPEGGWTHLANGPLDVNLLPEAVRTANGLYAKPRNLGTIPIAIEPNRIPAEASIKITKLEERVAADIRVEFPGFPYYSIVDWGEPRQEGYHFILDAEAAEVAFVQPPEGPLVEEHRYLLNPIPGDELNAPEERTYTVEFRINGVSYADAAFSLPYSPPPSEPVIRPSHISMSAITGPDGVTHAHVELDFRDVGYGVSLQSWEEPIRDGRHLSANAIVNRQDSNDDLPTPGAPPVFSNDYFFENLPAGDSYEFVIRVNGEPVGRIFFVVGGDGPFEQWLADALTQANGAETADAALRDMDDLDGDGVSNFYEWAMGLNALDPEERKAIHAWVLDQDGTKHFAVSYRRRVNDGAVYRVEVSNDLSHWFPAGDFCDTTERKPVSEELEEVTLRFRQALPDSNYQFIRVLAERTTGR